jgi:hypothetical protein
LRSFLYQPRFTFGHIFAPARFGFSIRPATSSALFRSTIGKENCDAVIRVYDEVGNVIETHEKAEEFK